MSSSPIKNKDIATIHSQPNDKFSIIILGAGCGNRMKSYGPKPLIEIKNRISIIDNQLHIINNTFSKKEIILVSGFESHKLMDNTPDYIIKVENERFETTNVIRSIAIGLRAATTNRVLIIYGDLVFNTPTLACGFNNESLLIIDSNNTSMKSHDAGCNIANHFVEAMLPDLNNKWTQIAFFTNKELILLKKFCWNKANEQSLMFEAVNFILNKQGKIKAVTPPNMHITDIDSSKDIDVAKNIL